MTGDQIIDAIEEIFPDAHCELNHETPFQLLVAVVLSAQTTDASVNKVTPALFSRWPDANTLQNASLAEVEGVLKTLGLYRTKAKNIIALSRALEENFSGQVPSTFKELQSLPGVGRKTANVVRSVAFDIPSLAVDTHVERVSKRLGLAKVQDDPLKVEQKLRRKISRSRWNKAHHDLIFFGRYFCTARAPRCDACPFVMICKKSKLDAYKAAQKERTMAKTEEIVSQADVLVQAQNAMDKGVEETPQAKLEKNDPLLADQVQVLTEAANAMAKGSKEGAHEKPLDDKSDAESLQQVIESKIIDDEQQFEENKLKTGLIDAMESE